MEVKVIIDLHPDVKEFLNRLFASGAVTVGQPAEVTVKAADIATAVPKPKKEKAKLEVVPAATTPEPTTVSEAVVPTTPATGTAPGLTLEIVRALAIEKSTGNKANKDAVQAKRKELGADSLNELDPAHFETFMAFLNTLA